MTTDELERLAASDEEMPDGLAMPEQLLFLTLRELYKNFRSGAVNRDRGKREKSRILVAYRGLAKTLLATGIDTWLNRILSSKALNQLEADTLSS